MHSLKAILVLVLIVGFAGEVAAQGTFTSRHLTVGNGDILVIAGPASNQLFGGGGAGVMLRDGNKYNIRFDAGAVYGVTSEFEVGAMVVPIRINPDFDYGDPTVFGTYKISTGGNDIGIRVSADIPIGGNTWRMNPGIPVLMRMGNTRIDVGLFLPMSFHANHTQLGLNVPFAYSMNFAANVFGGLKTGYSNGDFDAENTNVVPLGVFAGYTISYGGKPMDLTASFDLNKFWVITGPGHSINLDGWSLALGANIPF